MKKAFSNHSFRKENKTRQPLIIVSVLVVVILAIDLLSHGLVRSYARLAAVELRGASSALYTHTIASGIFSTRIALENKNRALEADLASMQDRAASLSALQAENEQLRGLVHLAQTSPGVTAPVVSSLDSSPYGTFLIGAGNTAGVHVGDLALSAGGYVVGRVSSVSNQTSVVTEVFEAHASIDALVSGASVQALGQGGGNARLQIPRGIPVKIGDVVSAPQLGGRPVAVVEKTMSNPADAYTQVYAILPANLSALMFVYIVNQ